MNILFLTLLDFNSINEHNIYTDLLREFAKHGHSLFVISPIERRKHQNTYLIKNENAAILKLKIGNTQKTNIIEKGISTISIEPIFIHGIKKYFSDVKFDLIMYSTPPITFCKAVEYAKNRDDAKTYLLLKDIFPQNAVDIGLLKKTGVKGLLYKYFRNKEKRLYEISDCIGCMSQANVDYLINHNPAVNSEILEICPNAIEVQDIKLSDSKKVEMRKKYGIPIDMKIFVYGGNLGKPQGISFMIECLKREENNPEAFFLIVGSGTEFGKLENYFSESKPQNMKLMESLPKEDYDQMIAACDIGMIFLDHRFTIPNFPSRLLAYMQAGLPVLAVTDLNTDIGKEIVNGGFGWWCESNGIDEFEKTLREIIETTDESVRRMQELEWCYLNENYTTNKVYKIITRKIKWR